jgi:hypothetical protein
MGASEHRRGTDTQKSRSGPPSRYARYLGVIHAGSTGRPERPTPAFFRHSYRTVTSASYMLYVARVCRKDSRATGSPTRELRVFSLSLDQRAVVKQSPYRAHQFVGAQKHCCGYNSGSSIGILAGRNAALAPGYCHTVHRLFSWSLRLTRVPPLVAAAPSTVSTGVLAETPSVRQIGGCETTRTVLPFLNAGSPSVLN